ncbi:MAG: hypothetical protein WA705_25030 [Candidatus Ozemobacteraceae bacterium]
MTPKLVPGVTALFMPRFWLANVEEVFHPRHPDDDLGLLTKIDSTGPRFLFYGKPGDVLILSCPVEEAFLTYVSQLIGAGNQDRLRVVFPSRRPTPWFLADAVREDVALMAELRRIIVDAKSERFVLEAYYQSPAALALAEELGIPLCGTPAKLVRNGLVDRLNDKVFFKEIAGEEQVDVIPGFKASDRESLNGALHEVAEIFGEGELMVRKALSGGGLGNLSGHLEDLEWLMPDFYGGGDILIEPCLDFIETLGSLVEITETGNFFRGIDVQDFENGCWCGFSFPYYRSNEVDEKNFTQVGNTRPCTPKDPSDQEKIAKVVEEVAEREEVAKVVEEASMRLANAVRGMGARGRLNVDWGVVRDAEQGCLKPIAIESNFRHNGLSHILDLAQRLIRIPEERLYIRFLENFSLQEQPADLAAFFAYFQQQTYRGEPLLISSPGRERGVIPILPPRNSRVGLALFAPSLVELNDLQRLVGEMLS